MFGKRSFLSVEELTRDSIGLIFEIAAFLGAVVRARRNLLGNANEENQACSLLSQTNIDWLKNCILYNLFYEPSTRTSSSFHAAMLRLGGQVLSITDVSNSSVAKGETLEDTIRCLQCYADVIVLRSPVTGAALQASKVATVPIINAGDGIGEHPTQALLDLYTIRERLGIIDGLTITMLGDLKHGRTVHSLAKLLAHYKVKINYVSPESLAMPQNLIETLKEKGLDQFSCSQLTSVLPETDVLYVTRVQKERFSNIADYNAVANSFVVNAELMKIAKEKMIVMHPLPRVNEISTDFDEDPRAAYFGQMVLCLFVC